MKFPFVSRSVYEDAVRRGDWAGEAADRFMKLLEKQIAKYDDLVKLMIERQAPPDPVAYEPVEPDLSTDIIKAIAQRASPNTSGYSHLVGQALELTNHGIDESEIIEKILVGDEGPV